MDFIPETLDALDELEVDGDGLLRTQLRETAERVREIAPDVAGISIASHAQGIVFTLVATDDDVAALDAVQYVESGPCVAALHEDHGMTTGSGGLLDEAEWHTLALAAAAVGIRSTLTLPVRDGGRTVGTINLYGRTVDTFVGRHAEIADAVGGWAPGAVTNADLAFTTRTRAEQARDLVRYDDVLATVAEVMADQWGTDPADARNRLLDAAARAGVRVGDLARRLIDAQRIDGPDQDDPDRDQDDRDQDDPSR